MRIALVTYGSRGDVQPFIALGRALRADGHEPVLCAPSDFEGFITGHGLPFRPVGRDAQAVFRGTHGEIRGMYAAMAGILDRQFAELPAAVADCQLLLAGGIVVAGRPVAEALGIPYRFVAFCPRVKRSAYHAVPMGRWVETPRWVNAATWWFNDLLWHHIARQFIRRSGFPLRWEGSLFDCTITDRPLLAADPLLAPLPPDLAGRMVPTGAWFVPDEEPLPDELEDFLAAGAPPVYIGFGSMVDLHPERTTRWIVQAVEAAGVRAVISAGWAKLGEGAVPPGVKVIGPVAHEKLFPRVCAVVHHGGAGTAHTAARAGVPQVLVPHLLDQFYWAHRLQALGVAPGPVHREQQSVPRLAAALRACVEDAGLRQRARELAPNLIRDGLRRTIEVLQSDGVLKPA